MISFLSRPDIKGNSEIGDKRDEHVLFKIKLFANQTFSIVDSTLLKPSNIKKTNHFTLKTGLRRTAMVRMLPSRPTTPHTVTNTPCNVGKIHLINFLINFILF